MKIYKDIYDKLTSFCCKATREEGGIIGGYDDVVCVSYHDVGIPSEKSCAYIPNINILNDVLARWERNGVIFMGMYHIHFWDVYSLSEGDKLYIAKILNAMPDDIKKLYFPLVVLPANKVICYAAKLMSRKLTITHEELTVICRNHEGGEIDER